MTAEHTRYRRYSFTNELNLVLSSARRDDEVGGLVRFGAAADPDCVVGGFYGGLVLLVDEG